MSGILTQAPTQATPHRASSTGRSNHPPSRRPNSSPQPGDHHVHLPKVPRWTTPNLLRAGGALIGGLALIAAAVVANYGASVHGQLDALDHVDAPSVQATSDFLLQVEDMDAQLANALLISGDTTLATTRAESVRLYERDRRQADTDLQTATAALAGNRKKLDALAYVADLFGTYQEYATRAVQLDEQSGVTKAGTAPANVVAAYRDALVSLAGQDGRGDTATSLIAQARALNDGSTDAIRNSAQQAQDTLDIGTGAVLVLGALPLGALLLVQFRMSRKFHRRFNPALIGASTVAAVLMIAGYASFQGVASDVRNGKSNAFDSVQALTLAKATSYDANADESRWLLDRDHAANYERSFLEKAQKIAGVSISPQEISVYEKNVDGVPAKLSTGNLAENPFSPESAFGAEFRNITFPGEADVALSALDAYNIYLQGDAKIRQFPISTPQGLHDAIDFDTNAKAHGTSDQTFNAYSDALDNVIALNQREFASSMTSAESGAGTWSWLPYVFLALIVGLTVVGLRPRLNEYR